MQRLPKSSISTNPGGSYRFPSQAFHPLQASRYRIKVAGSPAESQHDLSTKELSPAFAINPNDVQRQYAEAYAMFAAKLGARRSHAKYLEKALRGFIGAVDVNAQKYDALWSARTKIFVGSGRSLYTISLPV